MAHIAIAPKVLECLDRILAFQMQHKVADAGARVAEIMQAIDVLAHNPLIGRHMLDGKRDLVIGRNANGYLALYKYVDQIDTVFVFAVRSQREVGYFPD